jgi:hypothetical protein
MHLRSGVVLLAETQYLVKENHIVLVVFVVSVIN